MRSWRDRDLVEVALVTIVAMMILGIGIYHYNTTGINALTPTEAKDLSVGDTVYVKIGTAIDGNGVVKSYDKSVGMTVIAMKDNLGRDITLNVHYSWIGSIVTNVPEETTIDTELAAKVKALEEENRNMANIITSQQNYIDKIRADMNAIDDISSRYR